MRMLTSDEVREIHLASHDILEQVGIPQTQRGFWKSFVSTEPVFNVVKV